MLQLVHDLRTPLGVAVGYLRLLRDHRLPDAGGSTTGDDGDRRRVGGHVPSVSGSIIVCRRLDRGGSGPSNHARAELTDEVARQLPPPLVIADIDHTSGSVRARLDGATARAVAALLSRAVSTGGATPSTDIIVRVADAHLNFLAGTRPTRGDAASVNGRCSIRGGRGQGWRFRLRASKYHRCQARSLPTPPQARLLQWCCHWR